MNDREVLLNSIFFPRPSYKGKDEKDHLIEVEDDIWKKNELLWVVPTPICPFIDLGGFGGRGYRLAGAGCTPKVKNPVN